MAHLDTFIYLNQGKDSLLILGDRFSEGTKLPGRRKMTRHRGFDISLPSCESRCMDDRYLKAGSLRWTFSKPKSWGTSPRYNAMVTCPEVLPLGNRLHSREPPSWFSNCHANYPCIKQGCKHWKKRANCVKSTRGNIEITLVKVHFKIYN